MHGKFLLEADIQKIANELEGFDIVINVAGRSIFAVWTKKNKREIYRSRVELSRNLVSAFGICRKPPHFFLSASTIGIYKSETLVTENDWKYGSNFLADLVKDWEREVFKAERYGISVSAMRFGIVLGKGSGAYRIMRNLTRFNLGGYFGKGRQSLSFIYIQDLIRAITFLIEHRITGVVNFTAPEHTDFKTAFRVLKRKFGALIIWPVPEFVPAILLGEASLIYLEGQKVIPEVLTKNSFNFEASNIDECVSKIEAH